MIARNKNKLMFYFGVTTALAVKSVFGNAFDWKFANISLRHSESAYCDPPTYLTRSYYGVLDGFVPVYAIDDPKHDTHGYIGYTPSQNAIYVTFRGTETLENWLDDLDVVQMPYPLCDNSCMVHKGFYLTEQSCYPGILAQVQLLKAQYPSFSVIVTGHSLGGALATLTAMDLVSAGVDGVRLFNFGSPRVGDSAFAQFVSDKLGDAVNRVTHHKDLIVHTPGHFHYMHIDHEWYQPGDDVEVVECKGYEDESCSYQWAVTSVEDHMHYLGVDMGIDGCDLILLCDYC